MCKSKPCHPLEFSVPFNGKICVKGAMVAASMTGFGRAEVCKDGITVSAEIRSVNSRYLDLTTRLPRILSQREKDIRDIVRSYLSRGSLNIVLKIEYQASGTIPLKVNASAAKSYINYSMNFVDH